MVPPNSPPLLLLQAIHALADALRRVQTHADEEAIHDARVATRKLDALLHLLATPAADKRVRKSRRRIRELRRALGAPRNLEVALLMWEAVVQGSPSATVPRAQAQRVTSILKSRRDHARKQAARDASRMSTRALRTLHKLVERHGERLGQDIHAQFSDVGDRVVQAARQFARDGQWPQLHRLRIRFKQLRYAVEWAEALGLRPPASHDTAKDLKRVQDAMGKAMDAHVGWPLFLELAPSLRLDVVARMQAERDRRALADATAQWVQRGKTRHQA